MSSKSSKRVQKPKSESVEEPEKQTKVSKTKGGEKEHKVVEKVVEKVAKVEPAKASKHEKEEVAVAVAETPARDKKTRAKPSAKESVSTTNNKLDVSPNTEGDLVQDGGKPNKNYRYFRIIDEETGKALGRYKGRNPKQAVGKAYSKLVRAYEKRDEKLPVKLPIHIRESTRTGNKKIYSYYASRKKLLEPTVVTIKSKTGGLPKLVEHKFKNDIRKMPKEERQLNFMDNNEAVKPNKKVAKNPRKKLSGSKTKPVAKKTNSKTREKKDTSGVKQTQSKTKGKK